MGIVKVLPDGYFYNCSWLAGDWLTDITSRIWQVFMSLAGGVSMGLVEGGGFGLLVIGVGGFWVLLGLFASEVRSGTSIALQLNVAQSAKWISICVGLCMPAGRNQLCQLSLALCCL